MAITCEAIWQAADQLNEEGAKPTLNAVRKKLGGGSFTTISDAMSQWKERQRQRAQPAAEPLPGRLASSLNALAAEVWVAARATAERALTGERERLAAEQAELREQAAEAVELADTLTAEVEGLRAQLAEASAARDKLAGEARKLQEFKQSAEREAQRAVERAMAKDLEVKDVRTSERDARDRAGRAEGEVASLRAQLANAQAVSAERSKLAQELQDLQRHTAQEIDRAAERAARKDAEAVEASKSKQVALDRAARAEGEAAALREQLAQLTAALRERSTGAVGRRG